MAVKLSLPITSIFPCLAICHTTYVKSESDSSFLVKILKVWDSISFGKAVDAKGSVINASLNKRQKISMYFSFKMGFEGFEGFWKVG